MYKFQVICTQSRIRLIHRIHILIFYAVLPISCKGCTHPRHLHPYLMMAPCNKPYFREFPLLAGLQNPITQNCLFCSCRFLPDNLRTVFSSVFSQKIYFFRPLIHRFFHIFARFSTIISLFPIIFNSVCPLFPNGEIVLFHSPILKLAAQPCCRGFCFGKYQKSLHRLIQTVNNSQIRSTFFRFFFIKVVLQYTFTILRARTGALDRNTCRLVTNQQVRILKYNL